MTFLADFSYKDWTDFSAVLLFQSLEARKFTIEILEQAPFLV
jgi:hypothetical protein